MKKLVSRFFLPLILFVQLASDRAFAQTLYFHLQDPAQPWTSAPRDTYDYDLPIYTTTSLPADWYRIIFADGTAGPNFQVQGSTAAAGDKVGTYFATSQGADYFGVPPSQLEFTGARLMQANTGFVVGYASGGQAIYSNVTLGGAVTNYALRWNYYVTYTGQTGVEPLPGDDEHWGFRCGRRVWLGMAGSSVDLLHASLVLGDTPISYEPPYGPAMDFTAIYQQLDPLPARPAAQTGVGGFSHLGPGWSCEWLSYISDTPGTNDPVTLVWRGFKQSFANYDPVTQSYAPHRDARTVLKKLADASYQLTLPDGSRRLYSHGDGGTVNRRVHLTQIIDPQDNAVTLTHNAWHRLMTVTDATGGRSFTLAYENAQNYYQITRVTDSTGKSASFQYNADGTLWKITDSVDLVSEFTYVTLPNTTPFVSQLTTPYGVTKFRTGGADPNRSLEITDPVGGTERYEYREWTQAIADAEPVAPAGFTNSGLQFRNSFYWSKKAMGEMTNASGTVTKDYGKAQITHWLKSADNGKTVAVPHSTKEPLEGRVWYQYAAQPGPNQVGAQGQAIKIARVLDDNTTQASLFTYNTLGNVTEQTDPVGRRFAFDYATGGIDLQAVRQIRNGANQTTASFWYYTKHQPQLIQNAAGKNTNISYNALAQVDMITNAKGEKTKYVYYPDASGQPRHGRVQSVTEAFGTPLAATTTLDYDGFGRLASVQQPDGYAVTIGYDAIGAVATKTLDRPTRVTYPGTPTQSYEEITWNRLDPEWTRDRRGLLTRRVHDALRRVSRSLTRSIASRSFSGAPAGRLRPCAIR